MTTAHFPQTCPKSSFLTSGYVHESKYFDPVAASPKNSLNASLVAQVVLSGTKRSKTFSFKEILSYVGGSEEELRSAIEELVKVGYVKWLNKDQIRLLLD